VIRRHDHSAFLRRPIRALKLNPKVKAAKYANQPLRNFEKPEPLHFLTLVISPDFGARFGIV
jgi:hypothetical protein